MPPSSVPSLPTQAHGRRQLSPPNNHQEFSVDTTSRFLKNGLVSISRFNPFRKIAGFYNRILPALPHQLPVSIDPKKPPNNLQQPFRDPKRSSNDSQQPSNDSKNQSNGSKQPSSGFQLPSRSSGDNEDSLGEMPSTIETGRSCNSTSNEVMGLTGDSQNHNDELNDTIGSLLNVPNFPSASPHHPLKIDIGDTPNNMTSTNNASTNASMLFEMSRSSPIHSYSQFRLHNASRPTHQYMILPDMSPRTLSTNLRFSKLDDQARAARLTKKKKKTHGSSATRTWLGMIISDLRHCF